MAEINYQTGAFAKLTIDEVIGSAPAGFTIANAGENGFTIVNNATGYQLILTGTGLQYSNNVPTAGTITGITPRNAGIDTVANIVRNGDEDGDPISFSAVAFYNALVAGGARAALNIAFTGRDVVRGTNENDRLSTYGAAEDTIIGDGGNDTIVIGDGVGGVTIFGTNVFGGGDDRQTDIVEVTGSATIREMSAIDLVRFTDTGSAVKVLQISPFGADMKAFQGSATGTNTLLFTLANEAMRLDLSKVTFTNWSRDDQTIRIVANTNAALALDDNVVGSTQNDWIEAGQGRDVLYGGAGNDTLLGGAEADILDGGAGNDRLEAGDGGPNILIGGLGNDSYSLGANDTIVDAGGIDTILVTRSTTLAEKEKVFEGLAVYDVNSRNKVDLKGNKKANILDGNAGVNKLEGGAGNDSLSGWDGRDILTGGDGKDTFAFEGPLSRANVDRITDFRAGDRIELDRDIFTALAAGRIKSSMLRLDSKAKDKDDFLIYDKAKGALYYDADGSGRASSQIQIATLDNKATLAFKDFLIV